MPFPVVSSPVVVSGFGPFEDVLRNPSGLAALELAVRAPRGTRAVGGVLPVSFHRAPAAFDRLLCGVPRPAALLALGVHRGHGFRIERRARGTFSVEGRPDVDGGSASALGRIGPDLAARVDSESVAERLRAAGAPSVELSDDAGGYVCERIYHHVLQRAGELDLPAVFVHVPPLEALPVARQVELLAEVVGLLARTSRPR